MTDLTRRRSLAFAVGAVAAVGITPVAAHAAVKSFVAFGDSYTMSFRAGIPTWADQIAAAGEAKMLADMAISGATAAGVNQKKTLDGQVDRWIADYKAKGVPDRTVIYMGNNDVGSGPPSLSAALAQYARQVDRLIANGVTQGARRLVLCLLHDWTRNPELDQELPPAGQDLEQRPPRHRRGAPECGHGRPVQPVRGRVRAQEQVRADQRHRRQQGALGDDLSL